MTKDFLRNDKKARNELRETLDHLDSSKKEEGFLQREFRKLKKISGGVL